MLTIGTATPPVDPPFVATFRPDAELRLAPRAFVGAHRYAVAAQRVTASLKGRPARTATFTVQMINRGNAAEQLTVRGTPRNGPFGVTYLHGGKNVTAGVVKGTFRTGAVAPGNGATMLVKVTKARNVKVGATRTFTVRVASTRESTKVDTVAAIARVVR